MPGVSDGKGGLVLQCQVCQRGWGRGAGGGWQLALQYQVCQRGGVGSARCAKRGGAAAPGVPEAVVIAGGDGP